MYRLFVKILTLVFAFTGILNYEVYSSENKTDCLTQESIISKLETIESTVSEIHIFVQQAQQSCSIEKDVTKWNGNQSSFGNFRRLPDEVKENLKFFRLENMEDLDIAYLMHHLKPCTALEVLHLENIELIGIFPNSTSKKLFLPKLNDFRLVLTNYPTLNNFVNDINFVKKNSTEGIDIKKITDYDLNIFVEVGGWRKYEINFEFGEFVYDSQVRGQNVQNEILENMKLSSEFILRRLSLKGVDVQSELIPSQLTYLNLDSVILDGSPRQVPLYMEVIKRNLLLKEIHINPPPYPGDDHEQPKLDLEEATTYKLKKLSLTRVRIDTVYAKFGNIEEVFLYNCHFENRTIENFKTVFGRVKKFGLIPFFLSSGNYQCHTFLEKLISRYSSTNLEWVFIGDCTRNFGEWKPAAYEAVEKILTSAGLDKFTRDFVLEKSENHWIGRKVSKTESKEIIYRMTGQDKFLTLQQYLNVY